MDVEVTDLGVLAAHDPRQPDRHVVGVADEQLVGRQRARHPVERGELLAILGDAHADPAATEGGEVVGVVRLVELEHHVVADVDDVVDRPLPDRRQPGGHPRRAGCDDDPGEHGQGEPATALPREDLHGGVDRVADGGERRSRMSERQAQLGSQIARYTDVAEGVGAIAGDVDVEHDVVDEAGDLAVGYAQRRVRGEDEDAAVVAAEAQLTR